MTLLADIDALIARDGAFAPRWGWHDDHREADGTPEYLPALQQVRSEFDALLDVLTNESPGPHWGGLLYGSCLQLGLGECFASHRAWQCVFDRVTTLDWGATLIDDEAHPGVDIQLARAQMAGIHRNAPYDFLFIDAGHSAEDARRDHANYGPMVRPGGIIAFHDALRRPGFEEAVQVWRYLADLREPVNMIGHEVGVAWLRV